MNGGKYSNEEYDALIRQAASMPAGEERFAVLKQAEDILINQDQAIIPLYVYVSQGMIDTNKWGGWYNNTRCSNNAREFFRAFSFIFRASCYSISDSVLHISFKLENHRWFSKSVGKSRTKIKYLLK